MGGWMEIQTGPLLGIDLQILTFIVRGSALEIIGEGLAALLQNKPS